MKQVCTRCIYDETIPKITFDSNGVCNYCKIHDQMSSEYPTGVEGKKRLKKLAEDIKKTSRSKEYDCIVGVSGGCDSSYLCWLAKEVMGLKPLAVHFDNTWNSKIAVENIQRVLKNLDIDLYTYVMDNDEFADMAKSMLLASVPEIDALTDIALATTMYMAADKNKVRYMLNGHSFRTEGITPLGWVYFDGKYIQSIHKQFGSMKMERFPNLWLHRQMKWMLKGIKQVRPLYYVDYDKETAKKFMSENFDWQWYGGHHMENRYTIFNDNFLLPRKFKIDLRYVEFSALVRSGQMDRNIALKEMQEPMDFDEEILTEVKKRLNLSDEEFDRIIALPPKSHRDYKTYHRTFRMMRPIFYLMYKADRVPKSFYVKYTKKSD